MLVKENIKVGSMIQRFNIEYVLILKISSINDHSMIYDALILPSKKVVYHDLVSMFHYWEQVV
jgi:hypothetical protein